MPGEFARRAETIAHAQNNEPALETPPAALPELPDDEEWQRLRALTRPPQYVFDYARDMLAHIEPEVD